MLVAGTSAAMGAQVSPTVAANSEAPSSATVRVLRDLAVAREAPEPVSVDVKAATQERPAALDNPAFQRDVAAAAKALGQTEQAVAARNAGMVEFDAASDRLMKAYPDAVIETGARDDGTYWIEVGRTDPHLLVKTLGALPFDVTITRRVDATATEIESLKITAFHAIAKANQGGATTARYDAATGKIVVDVAALTDGLRSTAEAAAKIVLDQLSAAQPDDHRLPVPVEVSTKTDESPDVIQGVVGKRGGRGMAYIGQTDPVCTSGFIVGRNGREGIITAQHCPNNLAYGGQNILTYITAATDDLGANIDIQYHRFDLGTDVDPYFRADGWATANDRRVEAVANAPVGTSICKWGDATAYTCSQVQNLNMCGTLNGEDTCGLDQARGVIADHGDSGGPWFFSTTARGITGGVTSTNTYFTRIGRVSANLDATVLR